MPETNAGEEFTTSKPKSLVGNATWNILLTIWLTGVSFFLTPFLIAKLGTEHYGLFILLMSISGLMGIMNLGLNEATLRFVAYHYSRRDLAGINRVIDATFSVYLLTGFLAWLVLFLSSSWVVTLLALSPSDHESAVKLVRLVAFNVGLGFISSTFLSIPQALQRYDIHTRLRIAQSLFHITGTVFILLSGYGIHGLVLWSIATSLFTAFISFVAAKWLIPRIRIVPLPSKEGLKEIFSYGIFSLISQVLGIVWKQADRFLLGIFISPSAVAYLTVPHTLVFRAMTAANQTGSALFPRFSTTSNQAEIRRLYLSATWTMLRITVFIFVPMTVLIPDFLRLWISPEFSQKTAFIGQIIAVSSIVRGAFIPYEALWRGIGKPQYITKLVVCTALTSIITNLVLIHKYGLAGAGYCYAITPLWGLGAIWITWRRVLGQQTFRPLLRVFVLPLVLSVACLAVFATIRSMFSATVGWAAFIGLGLGFFVLTVIIVVGSELLLVGRSYEIKFFSNYARSLPVFRKVMQ